MQLKPTDPHHWRALFDAALHKVPITSIVSEALAAMNKDETKVLMLHRTFLDTGCRNIVDRQGAEIEVAEEDVRKSN